LPPTGPNGRSRLKALKIVVYVGLLNSVANLPSGPPAGGAWCKVWIRAS
jgi:hypothetical protein